MGMPIILPSQNGHQALRYGWLAAPSLRPGAFQSPGHLSFHSGPTGSFTDSKINCLAASQVNLRTISLHHLLQSPWCHVLLNAATFYGHHKYSQASYLEVTLMSSSSF
ncbi:Triple Functional Domain Protein [Manis pentadactyla]|nr:Triple Functional Domain Protein [Manis pentadactyla]